MKKFAITLAVCIAAVAARAQSYCIPQTQTYCCGYGIVSVSLPGVTQASPDAAEGYRDFSASVSQVNEGVPIPVDIRTGGIEPHDVRIWLDADNNGTFSHPGELVFEMLNAVNPSGNLQLPAGILYNTNLRLRITADFAGSDPLPCQHPNFGQTEDYSLRVVPSTEVPAADFLASVTSTCNGVVYFTNRSTGNPSGFHWEFGDGQTSTAADPVHVYTQNGTYTVRLSVSNSAGSDTEEKTGYIHVALSETCDTFAIPAQGNYTVLYNCRHVITDNGKALNYSDNTNGVLTLAPAWAEKVCIRFSEFRFEKEFDYLEIFDGATPAAPRIGKYSGTELPPEICSTGPALCLRQYSDDVVNYTGFTAQATCTMGNEPEPGGEAWSPDVYPNPSADFFQIGLPVALGDDWSLTLFSLTGQTVYRQLYHQPTVTVSWNETGLTAGVYLAEIRSRVGSRQQKIIRLP